MVFGIRGFLPAGSFPAGLFGWGWTPTACRQGMPPARRGFVRGQENDRPDAALGFDREPVVYGFLPQVFHGPGPPHRMPVDGRVAGFTGRCEGLR